MYGLGSCGSARSSCGGAGVPAASTWKELPAPRPGHSPPASCGDGGGPTRGPFSFPPSQRGPHNLDGGDSQGGLPGDHERPSLSSTASCGECFPGTQAVHCPGFLVDKFRSSGELRDVTML